MTLSPADIAKPGTEDSHQKAIMQWIVLEGSQFYPLLTRVFHVPNGGGRSPSVGALMKAMGVRRGVPDLVFPVPIRWYGLWLELKKPSELTKKNGGRSDEQVEWAKFLRAQGYAVVTAYGWEAGVRALVDYYEGVLPQPEDDALVVS